MSVQIEFAKNLRTRLDRWFISSSAIGIIVAGYDGYISEVINHERDTSKNDRQRINNRIKRYLINHSSQMNEVDSLIKELKKLGYTKEQVSKNIGRSSTWLSKFQYGYFDLPDNLIEDLKDQIAMHKIYDESKEPFTDDWVPVKEGESMELISTDVGVEREDIAAPDDPTLLIEDILSCYARMRELIHDYEDIQDVAKLKLSEFKSSYPEYHFKEVHKDYQRDMSNMVKELLFVQWSINNQ